MIKIGLVMMKINKKNYLVVFLLDIRKLRFLNFL